MIVMIDALAARYGGTAYAVLQLIRALERRDDVARVVVIAQRDSIVGRDIDASDVVAPILPSAPGSRLELAWRLAWETRQLPGVVAEHSANVLVSMSGMLPRRVGCPVICVLANPVPFTTRSGTPARLRRIAIKRTLRHAIVGYVPSEAMRSLVGFDGLRVVPLGVDHERFGPSERPGSELLYVADFYAHKRHDLLLEAWSMLPEPKPHLRLVGNPAVDARTFAAVRAAASDTRIHIDGRVSFRALLAAYADARALVLCSERESFALPIAEALASGVPVVIRDDPVLRETAGPGALVVADDTPVAWARALQRVLGDDVLHGNLRDAGLLHSRRFTWDAMASEIVADARKAS